MEPLAIALVTLVFLVAGTVKGVTGLGLPTTVLGLATLFTDPRTAIALVLLPMMVSNIWQVTRMGEVGRAMRTYLPLVAVLVAGIWITIALSAEVRDRTLYAVLGGMIIVFALVNLRFRLPIMPPRWNRPAQLGVGAVAGVLGGLCGVFAPPIVMYLHARQVTKDEFVRATGLILFFGTLPLVAGYIREGFMTLTLGTISAAMIVPTLAGFAAGEVLRRRLSAERFRAVLLYAFLVLGLNLLRRAIW